jgi:hypothetical protein
MYTSELSHCMHAATIVRTCKGNTLCTDWCCCNKADVVATHSAQTDVVATHSAQADVVATKLMLQHTLHRLMLLENCKSRNCRYSHNNTKHAASIAWKQRWICIYIHLHTYIHTKVHTHIRVCIHTYAYIYAYIHIHTYMHTSGVLRTSGRPCTSAYAATCFTAATQIVGIPTEFTKLRREETCVCGSWRAWANVLADRHGVCILAGVSACMSAWFFGFYVYRVVMDVDMLYTYICICKYVRTYTHTHINTYMCTHSICIRM